MPDEMQEDRVIGRLCAVWSEQDGHPAVILSHPDREHVPGGCDAIITRGDVRIALEHTSVHSMPQRPKHLLYLKEFRERVIPPLREALPQEVLMVAIPMKLIRNLPDPAQTAGLIRSAVLAAVPTIRPCFGRNIDDAPGLDFRIFVYRGTPARKKDGLITLNPYGPDDEDATEDMRRALRGKRSKLARYKTEGLRTVLVVDAPETYAFAGYFWEIFGKQAEDLDLSPFDEVVLAGSWGDPVIFTLMFVEGRVLRCADEAGDFWDAQARLLKRSHDG